MLTECPCQVRNTTLARVCLEPAAQQACPWICALSPLYLHIAISQFIYHARAAAGVWSPTNLFTCKRAFQWWARGQWQALKVIRTYSGAVIRLSLRAMSHVLKWKCFLPHSRLLSPRTGQERQQSAAVIPVMISLLRAIASHALFNKGPFEVRRSNPRLSFHKLPVHCKWNQNEEKEIKGKHLFFFSWALHSFQQKKKKKRK